MPTAALSKICYAMRAVDISNISYAYGGNTTLKDVTFSVQRGHFCALLGPNGAGKSTLFSILTGLFVPQSGRIRYSSVDLMIARAQALSKMGVVFQQTTLDMDLSVFENMRYFAALHGILGLHALKRIDACLDLLNVRERKKDPVRALNGGHRRRVEIARSLIHDPAILLFDEPTAGLDPRARQAITEEVHQLCLSSGKTVLWATHLTDEIAPQDDLVILHRGEVLSCGVTEDICQGRPLKEVFLSLTSLGSA